MEGWEGVNCERDLMFVSDKRRRFSAETELSYDVDISIHIILDCDNATVISSNDMHQSVDRRPLEPQLGHSQIFTPCVPIRCRVFSTTFSPFTAVRQSIFVLWFELVKTRTSRRSDLGGGLMASILSNPRVAFVTDFWAGGPPVYFPALDKTL